MTSLSTVGPATQRPVLACGGPLKMQGIMPSKGRSQIVFLYSVLKPPGEARRGEGKRTISVTKSWIPTCAVQRRWLRGRDLNPGPLGYEPNLSMARLCISMIYVEVDLRFSTLFWGILFSTCSSSCSRIVAQRWPNDVGHQTREKAYGSDLPVNLPSNLYNCCGSYRHDRLSEWPHEDLRGARCWATDSLYQLSRPWRGRVLFRLQRDE